MIPVRPKKLHNHWLLYRSAWFFVTITDGMNISQFVTRAHGSTYSFVFECTMEFARHGLITLTPSGRNVLLQLTSKGLQLQEQLRAIIAELPKRLP
jgi:hypothetical protein